MVTEMQPKELSASTALHYKLITASLVLIAQFSKNANQILLG